MPSKTRYRCKYCGVDEVRASMSVWELKGLRCKKCGHDKFDTKKIADKGNVYGYDEADDKPLFDWGED